MSNKLKTINILGLLAYAYLGEFNKKPAVYIGKPAPAGEAPVYEHEGVPVFNKPTRDAKPRVLGTLPLFVGDVTLFDEDFKDAPMHDNPALEVEFQRRIENDACFDSHVGVVFRS